MDWITKLAEDFQKVCQEGAKVYLVKEGRFGTMQGLNEYNISMNVGTKKEPMDYRLTVDEFILALETNKIVPKTRVVMGDNGIKVLPRDSKYVTVTPSTPTPTVPTPTTVQAPISEIRASNNVVCDNSDLQVGYLHVRTNKFSKEHKSGYSRILYKFDKQKITIEVTGEQIQKLKDLGVL